MNPNIGINNISTCGQELQGMMHGTTLSQVTNLYGVYNRAARRLLEDVDPQETKVYYAFGKVYQGVFGYQLPTDVKGNKVVDFYPQANRTLSDNFAQVYNKDFSLYKNYWVKPNFTPKYNSAVRTIELNASELVSGIQVNAADLINDNGQWNAGGTASTPINNSVFATDGVNGSVQTNLAAGANPSTGYLYNSTMTAVDLTNNYNNNANFFFQVYLPNASAFTSLDFRIGSSSGNYYEMSGITTTSLGNTFANGWNLISVPWSSMTTVGTPVLTAINYIYIGFTYNGTAQVQVLINQFYSRIGVLFTMEYYSKYLFRDGTSGVFQETVTADSNVVNLDTDGYNGFLFAAGAEAVQQMQGLDALFFDASKFETRYQAWLATYKAKYKSEILKPQGQYYQTPKSSYQRYLTSGWGYSNL